MGYAVCEYNEIGFYRPGGGAFSEHDKVFSAFFANPYSYSKVDNNYVITLPTPSQIATNETAIPNAVRGDLQNGEIVSLTNIETGDVISGSSIVSDNYIIPAVWGYYIAEYKYRVDTVSVYADTTVKYTFTLIKNYLPLKPYSITDVIVRVCDLLEPLQYGQKPRFRLVGVVYDNTTGRATGYTTGTQAAELDKIQAPEFSFSKATFREIMTQIGGRIHGEMRIFSRQLDNVTGKYYYEFGYDMYGSDETSNIKDRVRVTSALGTDINDYHTSLDSSVNNLINALDFAEGVVTSPFGGHFITLRSETTTARIEENDSTVIPTAYSIRQIAQTNGVICTKIPIGGTPSSPSYLTGGPWDMTDYLYEETDYRNLSSYYDYSVSSKSHAIYYSQGSTGVRGLFFKVPTETGYNVKSYSIINILREVTGEQSLTIPAELYPLLEFQVNYIPIYNDRIITPKALSIGGLPRTLAYNQSENGIEVKYFGENVKGVSARLGNVEKTETYLLAWLSDIPKIGTKYDDNYYISAVSCEFKPTHIVCMVGLSKNFNRLSNYIGINSQKRMWEISERQISERHTVWKRYCLVTVSDRDTSADRGTSGAFIPPLEVYFNFAERSYDEICASFRGYDYNQDPVVSYPVSLSVIGAAFGNVISLTFKMKDNYAAGDKSVYYNSNANDGVAGFFGQGVPYTDWYGRIYYGKIKVGINGNSGGDMAQTLPQDTGATGGVPSGNELCYTGLFVYRKDSRESSAFSIEYEAVTNDERIIIGSGLARNAKVVNRSAPSYLSDYLEFRTFTHRLSQLEEYTPADGTEIELTDEEWDYLFGVDNQTAPDYGYKLVLPNITGVAAWAICTKQTTTTENYQLEDGTETEVTVTKGGEILIGGNFAPGGKTVYFTEKQSIEDCYGDAEADVWQ